MEAAGEVGGEGHHDDEADDWRALGASFMREVGFSLKTAIIFMTSMIPIEGLRGSMMKEGVKKTLIHRRDQPACRS